MKSTRRGFLSGALGFFGLASVVDAKPLPFDGRWDEEPDDEEESTEETSSISVGSTSHCWTGVEANPREGETWEQARERLRRHIAEYERQDKIRMWQENAQRINERRVRRAARRRRIE